MNRKGKIIILTLLILIMCVCLHTVSYADTESTHGTTTYNVDITWGDLTYLYDMEKVHWDPELLKYVDNGTGVWTEKTPGSSGKINVKNSSNVDIKVGAAFGVQNLIDYGNITGSLYIKKDSYYIEKGTRLEERIEEGTLEKPTERTIVLKLKGKPKVYGKTIDTLGTVTITIDSEEQGAKLLSKSKMTLKYGETDRLTISNSEGSTVTWSSTNEDIVTVDETGNVTAKGIGTAKVIASIAGEKLECIVTVVSKKGVALSKSGVVLKEGATDTVELLGATTSEATWTSKNTSIATVERNTAAGREKATITAIGIGQTTVIVELNGEKFCINVYVIAESGESETCTHQWNIIETVYPTHFSDGYYILKCQECNEISYKVGEEKEECVYAEEVITEPTCKDKGLKKLTCECGYITEAPIEQVNYMVTYTTTQNGSEQVERFETFAQVRGFLMTSNMDAILETVTLENKNNYLPVEDRENENTSFTDLFKNATALEKVNLENFNTSGTKEFYATFDGCTALTTIVFGNNIDTSNVTNMKYMFKMCQSLTSLDVSKFNTSNVTNMKYMFYECNSLTTLDVSEFDTSQVTDMLYMFYRCSKVTGLDVSGWNTSQVTDMSYMFCNCNQVTGLDVSKWDTSNVKNMACIFYECGNLSELDVSKWNTSQVTNMHNMFRDLSKIITLDVSKWNTSNVTDMSYMFYKCSNVTTLDVSKWNTSNVTNMQNMFRELSKIITLDVSLWNTSKVTDMYGMFYACSQVTGLDVSKWNTSKVTNMMGMFHICDSLTTLNVGNFDTSSNESMKYMFKDCKKLTELDLSSFDTSKVTDMNRMFYGCGNLTTIYASEKFVINKVTDGTAMFAESTALVGNISYNSAKIDHQYANYTIGYFTKKAVYRLTYTTTNNAEPESMYFNEFYSDDGDNTNDLKSYINSNKSTLITVDLEGGALSTEDTITSFDSLFYQATALENITLDNLKISSFYLAFKECSKLTSVVFGDKINTSQATTMKYMFAKCGVLTELDVSKFNTRNVTDMSYMFDRCYALETIDVSNFDTSKVTNMYAMFSECEKVTALDVRGFVTNSVKNMGCMFYECFQVTELDVSDFDTTNVTYMQNMFYSCTNLTTLDISDFNTTKVTDMRCMFYNCSNVTALNVSGFDTRKVTNMQYMFSGCSNVASLDVSGFVTTNVTDMSYMFNACKLVSTLDVRKFNTSNVTNMCLMFNDCRTITSIDVSGFVTSEVIDMRNMFNGCRKVTSIDVSGFVTSKVTDMRNMFCGCWEVTELDLSNFDSSIVKYMQNMFYGCRSLKTIYASETFVTNQVTNGTEMFTSATALEGAISYTSAKTDHTYANYTTGYFTYKAASVN